jgi:hypothetical protein
MKTKILDSQNDKAASERTSKLKARLEMEY